MRVQDLLLHLLHHCACCYDNRSRNNRSHECHVNIDHSWSTHTRRARGSRRCLCVCPAPWWCRRCRLGTDPRWSSTSSHTGSLWYTQIHTHTDTHTHTSSQQTDLRFCTLYNELLGHWFLKGKVLTFSRNNVGYWQILRLRYDSPLVGMIILALHIFFSLKKTIQIMTRHLLGSAPHTHRFS